MTAAAIWRDFVTDGVPGSGYHDPVKSEIRAWGTEIEADIAALELLVPYVNDTYNNVSLGPNVRPANYVNLAAPLIQGLGNTLLGSDIMSGVTNAIANYTVFVGPSAGFNATNLYCVNGLGLRTFYELVDGQYMDAFGTDAGWKLTYGRSSVLFGPKAGLYKTSITSSTIIGSGAAYCAGEVNNSILIGLLAGDSNQSSTVQNMNDCIAIGNYSGRYMTGQYNVMIGNNAGSITAISGNYNLGIGRSTFGALTTGGQNIAIGDSAGGILSTGSQNIFIGFGVGMPAGGAAYANCVALGYQSGLSLTGSNQVQLGSTGHTVYTQSAISVRSDKRDKIFVGKVNLDTARAIVLGATWINYREDPRERYCDYEERKIMVDDFETQLEPTGRFDARGREISEYVKVPIKREEIERTPIWRDQDGSRAGKRHHAGVFAQDEYARLKALKIDFSGIKHAAHNGGQDVWSLQYEQYIPYMGAVMQHLDAANDNLRKDVDKIQKDSVKALKRIKAVEDDVSSLKDQVAALQAEIKELKKAA